jgi:molecular chaperone HtpG
MTFLTHNRLYSPVVGFLMSNIYTLAHYLYVKQANILNQQNTMQKGNIGITTENIFPVIKKFLYSDHEIFLREIVSNAVDATQKLKTLAMKGDFKGELGDLTVHVAVDKEAKTLTISDRGIGMTAEEIDKYINQIAFSGANDFLEKYKDDASAIIGHFGLGFYSSFMVADRVDIITRSYRDDAKGVKWTCDGSPAFEIDDCEKADRGTDIVLHISDDCVEFLEKNKIQELLTKYCRFLPIPIAFGKKTEWKDGKQVDTEEDNIVNDTTPLWTKTPSTLKDEDYKKFYRELYPMSDDPLFWIHLNVDYPFNLTGVLYFPRIKSNLDIHRNKIQLYCNQVFVTDQVENIVPDFLTLLHGVIDSPDIPLNVSRSYLQSDSNVKKISSYITKKVSDRLQSIFKADRKDFEQKWDDLKLFIHYGMLSENDFYNKAKAFALFKDVDGKYFTYDEYRDLIKDAQTDKEGNLIYLYATNKDEQYSYIETAKSKGYNVLLLDGQLDTAMVSMLEQKFEKSRFSRVDGDVIDRIIQKDNEIKNELPADEAASLTGVFTSELPTMDKTQFHVETAAMGEQATPVVITQSEYMRRMKDASRYQQGMSFYGEMPDMYNLVLNSDHRLVKEVLSDMKSALADKLLPIENELNALKARHTAIEQDQKDKKPEELTDDDKETMKKCNDDIEAQENARKGVWAEYGKSNPVVAQLIDLALLQNGLLKGEALSKFINRSVDLIK